MFVLPYLAINPVALELGSLKIHWYGIAYVLGILMAWKYCGLLLTRFNLAIKRKDLDDFIPIATLGIVLGGRLGQAIFYNPQYYLHKPWEIFYIWHPGMSFHGGLLGVILATFWFTRKRQIPFLTFTDIIAMGTPIGLFFGRLANFINSELYGRQSDVGWAMVFPNGGPIARHPSQLYEALLEGIFLFLMLMLTGLKYRLPENKPGAQSGIFLCGYATARVIVECFREPDAHIGYFIGGSTLGQLLCVPLFTTGLWLIMQPLSMQER